VLDERIRSGKEQTLVPVVTPTHPIGRRPVEALDSEDECVAVGLSDVMASHHDLVSDFSSHPAHLLIDRVALRLYAR